MSKKKKDFSRTSSANPQTLTSSRKAKQNKSKGKNKYASCSKVSIILILATILICIMPLSLAIETYPVDKNIELKFLCRYDGSIPAGSSYNITISYPNGSSMISNINTTSLGLGSFKYITNFSVVGVYSIQSFCYNGTASSSNLEYIEVTQSGIIATTAQGNLSIGLLIGIILIMFFFGLLSFKLMDYEKLYPIALFFLLVSIIIAVYGLYLGTIFTQDYLSTSTSAPQSTLFIGILYGLVGIMFLGLLMLIITALKEFKERKSLQRQGEGWDSKTKSYKY
jgi:hypothetical protein